MIQGTLIYDLDDTLVDTSDVYYFARQMFLHLMVEQGISSEQALEIFERVDTENTKSYGHNPKRYQISMLETYKIFSQKLHTGIDEKVINEIDKCGRIIIDKMPKLIEGAKELLEWGHEKYRQVLFTRGTEALQTQKILHSGLSSCFDLVKIVNVKSTEVLKDFIEEIKAETCQCWVVGDSIKSDINPAIDLGINCILYLYEHHSYFWQQEYGHEAKGCFYCVRKLLEVKNILEHPDDYKKVSRVY